MGGRGLGWTGGARQDAQSDQQRMAQRQGPGNGSVHVSYHVSDGPGQGQDGRSPYSSPYSGPTSVQNSISQTGRDSQIAKQRYRQYGSTGPQRFHQTGGPTAAPRSGQQPRGVAAGSCSSYLMWDETSRLQRDHLYAEQLAAVSRRT